jgi:hypothetical protein
VGGTGGTRRPPARALLGQSLSEIRHRSVPDPATRAFGATPIPIDYNFLALVPLPAKRSSPAVGGGRAGLHGSGMGLGGMEWDGVG